MKGTAYNRFTHEEVRYDTKDLSGPYYSLDKRVWEFEHDEEEAEEGEEPG